MDLVIQAIPVSKIKASPSNPRKTFDPAYIVELSKDIAAKGIFSPILCRPLKAPNGVTHELVFGECRWRAAKLAHLEEVPVMVRELTDREVLEIQIVENSKRADIHPLEEADGYQALLEKHGMPVEEIAAKVGKSVSTVLQRLKLCGLSKEVRGALLDDEITIGVALLIARVPLALQGKALDKCKPLEPRGNEPQDPPISIAQAKCEIEEGFMLQLGLAKFDTTDAKLVSKAGACTNCPKRTGNQTELFADVTSPDVCTDPVCYRQKVDAHGINVERRAYETRQTFLSDSASKKLFQNGRLAYGSDYQELDSKVYTGRGDKSVKAILGKDAPQPTLARNPETGAIVELVPKKLVEAALKKAGPERKESDSDAKWKADKKREKEKREREEREEFALIGAIVGKTKSGVLTVPQWRFLAAALFGPSADEICKRRGIECKKWDGQTPLKKAVLGMAVFELVGLVVETALHNSHDYPEACKVFGVDRAKVLAAMPKDEPNPAKKGKPKPASKANPKATAKKKSAKSAR